MKTIDKKHTRGAGVLLPIFSLPSAYSIGGFGDASGFISLMKKGGFSIWQILPITTIGSGNSPYSGHSAFAGSYLLIDIDSLPERWISEAEKAELRYKGSPYRVDYANAKQVKQKALNLAFGRLSSKDWDAINRYSEQNAEWLEDYALYRALKDKFGGVAWYDFPEDLAMRQSDAIKNAQKELKERTDFYKFEQYLFDIQWSDFRKKANDAGVKIFGDMPIYVDIDSSDIWANPDEFQLDERKSPTRVAGVPPDYFAKDGQLWGNPLYNFKKMKKDGYKWWIRRIKRNLGFYDILRIDHFRGLCEYWSVDAHAKTAKEGKWEEGAGMGLWKELAKELPNPQIVAEDLGDIDDKVRKYLEDTGFPGMRVLQFGFDGTKDNLHLPYNYDRETVAYTATHDNNTTLGWLFSLDDNTRKYVLKFMGGGEGDWWKGGRDCTSTKAAIKTVTSSVADTVIFPLQDLAGYGADTRTNIPGEPLGNWEFRATEGTFADVDTDYFRNINDLYGRIDYSNQK